MTKNNRGGKREGAGRPPKPAEEKKGAYTVLLPPEQLAWLKANGGAKRLREIIAESMGRD